MNERNLEGRRAVGLDPELTAELSACFQSKGRTPGVFVFNCLAEGRLAHGKSFTPSKHQAMLARDLENLPQFLCRQNDVVLLVRRPSVEFLSTLKEAGLPLPEFVELQGQGIAPESTLRARKISRLRPWAWSPDSVELLEPLLANLGGAECSARECFNEQMAQLYSKAWSASFLRKLLPRWTGESWICAEDEVGVAVHTMEGALEAIAAIRRRGHLRVVAKEAYGLAGQNSVRLWEPELREPQRRWMERAIQAGRPLVIEPWLERELDFSIQLEMGTDALTLCGYTGLVNDRKGQFQANWAAACFARHLPANVIALLHHRPGGAARLQRLYDEIRRELEAELRRARFVGPVGIDAFVYRTPNGDCLLKPIVEINPRYTMGRLTLELMKHTSAGSCGVLRLLNRAAMETAGFQDLAAYAQALRRGSPIHLEGEPVPKIREGLLCLNEPARAQLCLAVFQVGRTLEEVLSSFQQ